MALKSKTISFVKTEGLDQRWKGGLGFADEVSNFRIDPDGLGWVCDRGLESWWKYPSNFNYVANGDTIATTMGFKVDALYIWEKSSTGQVYHLIEQNGTLYYFWGNKGQGSVYPNSGYYISDMIVLDRNRHKPKLGDISTQFIPYGNRLLIINGYDKPIWFSGNEDWRDFSFTIPTPTPTITPLQPDYLSGSKAETGTAFPNFAENNILGLGSIDGNRNQYQYCMTYITADGAESPLSSPISMNWTVDSSKTAQERKFGLVIGLPSAPKGAVARRIYRTKNMKTTGVSGSAVAQFYFLKEIEENSSKFFIDVVGDNQLVTLGPDLISSTRINTTYKFGATWNNRIWLSGGDSNPTRIIYSEAGIPEQFPAANFFEIGNTQGGHITAVHAYYNNLLIFRRNAIEIIRSTPQGFTLSTLTNNIGTTASNAIVSVPNLGVAFLNEDGIWLISGGMDGGSIVKVTKISDLLDKELNRLNKAALSKAIGAYSPKERELWIHFPADGSTVPNRGAVLHTDVNQFSQRFDTTGTFAEAFNFSAMAVDTEGNFIIGTKPTWYNNAIPPQPTGSPLLPTSVGYVLGPLVVWSGGNKWGQYAYCNSYNQDSANYTVTENTTKPVSRWESNWIDFGDNSAKYRIYSVEAEIISYGDNLLELEWATDYDRSFSTSSEQKMTLSERAFTVKEDPVFGPVDSTVSKNFFNIGTSALQDGRIIRIRFDVSTGLISQFKFRLQTTSPVGTNTPKQTPFHLLSFHINYDAKDHLPLNQATNLQKGQAR